MASKEFTDCKSKIDMNETECRENWDQFQLCSGKLDGLKSDLKSILNRKSEIRDKASELLGLNLDSEAKKKETTAIESEYKTKIAAQNEESARIQLEIDKLKQQLETKSYSLSSLQKDLNHTQASYLDCQLRKIVF